MKLKYAPTEKGYVPGLEPGQVLEFEVKDYDEYVRLFETGLFEPEPVPEPVSLDEAIAHVAAALFVPELLAHKTAPDGPFALETPSHGETPAAALPVSPEEVKHDAKR